MQTKHFIVLVVVAGALAALIGWIEHGTIEAAIKMALITMFVIPIAFAIKWVGDRRRSGS